jgi:uncharacterized tellurite resistance protein B-like protein
MIVGDERFGGPLFDALRNFVSDLADGRKQNGLDDSDFRVSTAALLVHAAAVDGATSEVERKRLCDVLKQRFDLDNAAADELIEQATAADEKAVDLYRFTRLLNGSLGETDRLRVIEMMWSVAYADGKPSEYENHLIWRVADLLGVSSNERIALRNRIAESRGA